MIPGERIRYDADAIQHPLIIQYIFSGIPSWVKLEDVSERSPFINNVLPDTFPITGAFHAEAIANETGKFHFESLRFQDKLVQIVHIRTGDRLMGFGIDFVRCNNTNLLLLRVTDLENHIQVLVEGDGVTGGSAKEFNGDYIVFINRRKLQSQVITFLQFRLSGEPSITGNVLQCTCNLIVADFNSRLQVTCVLAEKLRPIVLGFNGGTY